MFVTVTPYFNVVIGNATRARRFAQSEAGCGIRFFLFIRDGIENVKMVGA